MRKIAEAGARKELERIVAAVGGEIYVGFSVLKVRSEELPLGVPES
jgi:hypothetical protein